jgi:hypothetical protein
VTFAIYKDAQSTLQDGIETIIIPITDERDFEQLTFNFQRGGRHGAVEWVLNQLHRPLEIDRVCGVDMQGNKLVLRLRQPGKQMEAWITEERMKDGRLYLLPVVTGNLICLDHLDNEVGRIAKEALDRKPFTQDNPPYWRKNNGEHNTNLGKG